MWLRRRSIFIRLVRAFVAVGMFIGVPLVLLSIEFSRRSSDMRLQQSVGQQMAMIEEGFRQEFSTALLRSLKQVTESDALIAYLLASRDEQFIKAKTLERSLLALQGSYEIYTGIYYVSGEGDFVVNVADRRRAVESGNLAEDASRADRDGASPTRRAMASLFARIRTTPLLLSSGNMEWFMPPRGVLVEGPFLDESGRLSFLAGMPLVDFDSGGFGGVVFIRVRLNDFTQRLQALRVLDESPTWLFAADGKVLVQPPHERDRLDPSPRLATGFDATLRLLKVDDGLVAFQDLAVIKDQPFLRLAYAIPASAIARDGQRAIYFYAVLLLVALAAVCVLAFFVSRNFSTPIVKLADAASRLARGDLGSRVEVASTGEIRVLVDSFNQLTDKLRLANQARANAFSVLRATIAQMQTGQVDALAMGHASALAGVDGSAPIDEPDELNRIRSVIDRLLQEREQNLRSVRAARDAADAANRAKGDFLATMSHEIRTPLNAVIGLSDVLARSGLNAAQLQLVKTMESAGGQLLQVINDVLDYSRLQSGRVTLNEAPIDLRGFMDRLMLIVGGLPDAVRLEIGLRVDPGLPSAILGDEARLMQILINLLGNAVKFTPAGRVQVEVVRSDGVDGSPWIEFAVTDTGPGIAADMRERIFEPFTQGVGERLRPNAGAGLGLAICRQLSRAMGGSVELLDTGPAGSRFALRLPLRPVRLTLAAASRPASEASSLPGLRVLVAEDTPANQLVIELMLKSMGHAVTMVNNGVEAVEAFIRSSFDLVLLDIQMPLMDGYEAARRIRDSGAAGRQVAIVALTAFTQNSDREKAQAAGIDDFVSKPIRARDIAAMLARAGLAPAQPS